MSHYRVYLHTRVAALVAAIVVTVASSAAGAGTTSWRTSMGGDIRLISSGGPLPSSGAFAAGLHLKLKTGWKTYWRFPGDSGIATSADFAGSINLKSADVAFPAPERHFDGFSTSIGYSGDVVLPLRVSPLDPAAPVLLNVKVTYGVCEKICVPLEDDLSLIIAPTSPADETSADLIATARASVPGAAEPGDPLSVTAVALDDASPRNFIFTAKLSAPSAAADLFVEGPEGSYLTVPALRGVTGATATWTLPLDGLVHDGDTAQLRLTLINGAAAVDQIWTLSRDDLD